MLTHEEILHTFSGRSIALVESHPEEPIITPRQAIDAMDFAAAQEAIAFLEWFTTLEEEDLTNIMKYQPNGPKMFSFLYDYWVNPEKYTDEQTRDI